jgi:hypothetical protein
MMSSQIARRLLWLLPLLAAVLMLFPPGKARAGVSVCCTKICTVTQGGYGAPAKGGNPATILVAAFPTLYPNGLTIGGANTLTFTSAAAVQAFLPQGGTPGVLTSSATNPTTSSAGVFAGQVLTLRLNIDLSASGSFGSDVCSLGSLVLCGTGTSLDGATILQIEQIAEAVLGGNLAALPSGFTVSSLNDLIDSINSSNDGCQPGSFSIHLCQ